LSTLERAIAIATEAHTGQVDKAGTPYIAHPLRVIENVSTMDEKIVAALHDVVEDCPAGPLIGYDRRDSRKRLSQRWIRLRNGRVSLIPTRFDARQKTQLVVA
jgi:hypothetical protein